MRLFNGPKTGLKLIRNSKSEVAPSRIKGDPANDKVRE
jgi:hypothetical protein